MEETRRPLGADVVARTRKLSRGVRWALRLALVALTLGVCGVAFGGLALADGEETEDPENAALYLPDPPLFRLTEARLRISYFDQRGRGWQSQDRAAPGRPGSERLGVFQPVFSFGVDQGDDVHHTIVLPVDIVTSASADALDAVSSASRVNEAVTLDITTEWGVTEDDDLRFRYGFHIEEPFRSGFFGFGYTHWLADDNATISIDVQGIFDWFDPITPQGWDLGHVTRQTLSANASVSQVLSRTTLAGASYGLTYQTGVLEQTWNVVPFACSDPDCPTFAAERLPDSRVRHAIAGWLAQRVPSTGTTLRARYRYYRDDFGIDAHTARVAVWQDAGEQLRLRAHYRVHQQSAPDFWTNAVPQGLVDAGLPRTADSDLARFISHEGGVGAHIFFASRRDPSAMFELELGYLMYARTTGLRIHTTTLGIAFRR